MARSLVDRGLADPLILTLNAPKPRRDHGDDEGAG